MMFVLNEAQLATLNQMSTQAAHKDIGYWQIYTWLADTMVSGGVSPLNSSVIWLRGATQANKGSGIFSALIRTYTLKQYDLRYGGAPSANELQKASDTVATNLISDIQQSLGAVPDLARIGESDATAVGTVLFNRNQSDSAYLNNSAWSGSLLFGMLGGDETWRLLGQGNKSGMDTLGDFRDVLYAVVSFGEGLKAAMATGSIETLATLLFPGVVGTTGSQAVTDITVLIQTAAAYLTGKKSFQDALGDFLQTTFVGAPGNLGSIMSLMSKVGPYRALDMLMGAMWGKSFVGATTEDTFSANAKTFFNHYSVADLAATPIKMLPLNAGALASLAKTDVDVRSALQGMSIFSIKVSETVASKFRLVDQTTGEGDVSDQWLQDRAKAVVSYAQYWRSGDTDNKLEAAPNGSMKNPLMYLGDVLISDTSIGPAGALTVDGQAPGVEKLRYLRFGNDAADTLNGGGENDSLYGGRGADKLNGLGGNDYLEGGSEGDELDGGDDRDTLIGGTGVDTLIGGDGADRLEGGQGDDIYRFTGSFGADVIEDLDGKGRIEVGGVQLTGAKKVGSGSGVYKDKDTGWVYAKAGSDLVIYKESDEKNRITIRNWSTDRSMGITLDDASSPDEGNSHTFIGDYKKKKSEDEKSYLLDGYGNYQKDGDEAGAADLITGTSDKDALIGLDGNDALLGKGGDDYIDGGAGADVLMGGTGADYLFGGAGSDIIYGSSMGALEYPTSTNFNPPVTTAPNIIGRGFNWILDVPRRDSDGLSSVYLTLSVSRDQQGNDKGKYIEGGSGEDVIFAGTGSDVVYGGDDADDIFGMSGADVLYGEAGGDRIRGDGSHNSYLVTYTLGPDQGNDVISGGAGNDTLLGQGADDELYGGIDDDLIYGDDRDLLDTPIDVNGNDYLDGGDGNDTLYGGGKDDELFGGKGDDTLNGDWTKLPGQYHGKDYLDGEDGNDLLVGNGNDDTLFGGKDNDTLLGDDNDDPDRAAFHGADYLDGEEGDDELVGGGGGDQLYGGIGDDLLVGDDPNVSERYHGNDYLDGGAGKDSLYGGGGDDSLEGGTDDDVLFGDGDGVQKGGNDVLSGGTGNDYLDGGDGDDTLLGGEGDDTLVGGNGVNVLDGGAGTDVYKIDFMDGALTTVADTDGNSYVLLADASSSSVMLDVNASTEGAIVLTHNNSAVKIVTSSGTGPVDNVIQFGTSSGSLAIHASQLRDYVGLEMRGTSATDLLRGGLLADHLSGGDGDDELHGSYGNDQMVGGNGADLLYGDDDNDTLVGGAGGDHLLGGTGQDGLTGDAGDDTLEGGEGDDVLIGGEGDDVYVVRAGDGVDKLLDTGGKDRLVFGEGLVFDNVSFEQESGTANVTLILSSGEQVTLFNGLEGSVETIEFGDGSQYDYQRLIGEAIAHGQFAQVATLGDDFMQGGAGVDVLSGLAGADTLAGGTGDDRLLGGSGQDTYLFTHGSGVDVVEDGEGGGSILRFGAGISLSDLSCLEETVGATKYLVISYGGTDQVRVQGGILGSGIASIQFDDNTAIAYADFLGRASAGGSQTGTSTSEAIYAGATDDVLLGLGGGDSLFGGDGNDTLRGGDGVDELHGGLGDDVLSGGANDDVLQGGAGADRYELTADIGHDVILDSQGPSVLVAAPDISTANLRFRRSEADLTIYLDSTATSSFTVKGFFDQPDLWNWQPTSGYSVSLMSLMQASAAAMSSESEASLVTTEMRYFRAAQTRDGLNKSFLGASYAQGSDGVYRWTGPDGSEGDVRTLEYTISSGVMFSDAAVVEFDTTPNDVYNNSSEVIGSRTYIEKYIQRIPQAPLLTWPAGYSLQWIERSPLDHGSLDYGSASGSWVPSSGSGFISMGIVERPDKLVEMTKVHTVTNYHRTTIANIVLDDLQGGASDNNITWFGGAVTVDAGAGNDYVNGLWGASAGHEFGEVYGGGREDRSYSYVGTLLYGNDGDDTLLGTEYDDELIGGAGEDKLDGYSGADTYRVYGASSGWDVIFDSGALTYEPYEWDGPVGVPLSFDGSFYLTRDALMQDVGHWHWSLGYNGDPALLPLANDVEGMERVFSQGFMGKDSVVFDYGITQSDLTVSRGTITLQGVIRDTLDISWGTGRGIRVVMPNAQDAVGLGIERFVFSDGQVLNALQMAALGKPVGVNPDLVAGQSLTDIDPMGENTVSSTVSLALTEGFENLTLTGSGNIDGAGNALDNVLRGNAGANHLDGSEGADTLYGGVGEDVFEIDNPGDVVVEFFNEGTDTVRTRISRALEANVENAIAVGDGAIDIQGNYLGNNLVGNAASNTLDGGAGQDTLSGGAGDDAYRVDVAGDLVREDAQGGHDLVISTASGYELSDNVEDMHLDGDAILGRGNAGANLLVGNEHDNFLLGAEGDDQLIDGVGNDVLDGGAGADIMRGGEGDDVYFVDTVADVLVETATGGFDIVIASTDITLRDNLEALLLGGGLGISGKGNAADNFLAGNGASNRLEGAGGNDILYGTTASPFSAAYVNQVQQAVNRYLFEVHEGGPSSDDGAGGLHGVDTLEGGEGDDTYVVDVATDVIMENMDEGTDTIQAGLTFTLASIANVENLTLIGTAAINGTGNSLSNVITGNNAANILDGGAGGDTLAGGAGDDTLNGGLGDDSMVGGDGNDTYYLTYSYDEDEDLFHVDKVVELDSATSGVDTVITSSTGYGLAKNLENLTLLAGGYGAGNALGNIITGSSAIDYLYGRGGDDTIVGGQGNDTLYGDEGDDSLDGGEGDDGLYGGLGTDTMIGGDGNDTYYVTNYWDDDGILHRDQVIEGNSATSGIDTVFTYDSDYTLANNVENLTVFAGALARGNSLGNRITGSDDADFLDGKAGGDTILSGAGNDIIWGGEGNDYIDAGSGNDYIDGGLGDDTLVDTSTTSNETYTWGRGLGIDTLTDFGGNDHLDIQSGITADQLWLRQVGNNLELSVIGTNDKFIINDWYASAANQVENLILSDGKTLMASKVDNLVNLMATFTPPAAGQTTLPTDYQASLNPAIAANWA